MPATNVNKLRFALERLEHASDHAWSTVDHAVSRACQVLRMAPVALMAGALVACSSPDAAISTSTPISPTAPRCPFPATATRPLTVAQQQAYQYIDNSILLDLALGEPELSDEVWFHTVSGIDCLLNRGRLLTDETQQQERLERYINSLEDKYKMPTTEAIINILNRFDDSDDPNVQKWVTRLQNIAGNLAISITQTP